MNVLVNYWIVHFKTVHFMAYRLHHDKKYVYKNVSWLYGLHHSAVLSVALLSHKQKYHSQSLLSSSPNSIFPWVGMNESRHTNFKKDYRRDRYAIKEGVLVLQECFLDNWAFQPHTNLSHTLADLVGLCIIWNNSQVIEICTWKTLLRGFMWMFEWYMLVNILK